MVDWLVSELCPKIQHVSRAFAAETTKDVLADVHRKTAIALVNVLSLCDSVRTEWVMGRLLRQTHLSLLRRQEGTRSAPLIVSARSRLVADEIEQRSQGHSIF